MTDPAAAPAPNAPAALRHAVQDSLQALATAPLAAGARALLAVLGYRSQKTADLGHSATELLGNIEGARADLGPINRDKVHAARWKSCALLFQLSDDEIPALAQGRPAPSATTGPLDQRRIASFVFLAIDLRGSDWSRSALAAITRELNRRFPMPALILFRHEGLFSLAVIDRRQNRNDPSRDVLASRITVIKDVRLAAPHRAHLDILTRLALPNLGAKHRPSNFGELYDAWLDTLSTQKLNEAFYRQLAYWYAWAVKEVAFPAGGGEHRNEIGVIRLLTRLIFVWFIKERGLVPEALFDRRALRDILKQAPDTAPEASHYYHAILQNLFFATLNQEMGAKDGQTPRRWAATGPGMKGDYLISLVYRYRDAFRHPDTVLQDHFAPIPFLNGGLFECLDEQLSDEDLARRPELAPLVVQEGRGWALRIDGFSRRAEAQAQVPNKLFFDGTADAPLDADFETKGRRYRVEGLIDLLGSYRFTVDENTPLEEEVALDPELLGKVFENLLASYNDETRSTARKNSGSFYTPREVVDYMVDEALIAYFARHLQGTAPAGAAHEAAPREAALRALLSHADTGEHAFSEAELDALVKAIDTLKVLDPACGSGAFPMGMLNKLVVALKKLDPGNQRWRAQNLAPLQQRLTQAHQHPDPMQRDTEIAEAEAALQRYTHDFARPAYADYTRKLHLIEKSLFGVDIQPIAVQIAKLRFFIALIVSQPIDREKPNWGIIPLPNLETKIVAANTLFAVPREKPQLELDFGGIKAKEDALRRANAAYLTAHTRATKQRRKQAVHRLHEELAVLLKQGGGVLPADAERMARWNPFDQNRSADFFDVEWMFGMPRAQDKPHPEAVFDIVIGNPPYVRQEGIKPLKPLLKTACPECYTGTADLYVYFYERAVTLLKPHGVLSFITSNKWYRAKYGEALRAFMARETQLKQILDFGDTDVFTAIAYPTIVIATRREEAASPAPAADHVRTLNWTPGAPVETFPAVFAQAAFALPQAALGKESWQLEPSGTRELLARIRKAGTPLATYVKGRFYYGIKTGLNEAFIIDGATRARLIAQDPNCAAVIKPFLRGRDVKRWQVESKDLWLIFTRRPFPIDQYPAIKQHLSAFKKQLMPKPATWDDKRDGKWEGRAASGSYQWYEIQANTAYWQEFEQSKLIIPAITTKPCFAPDLSGYYSNNKTTIYLPEHLHFALGVLNSSVNAWLATKVCATKQNGAYDFEPRYSSQLIVPSAHEAQRVLVEAVVKTVQATRDPRYEGLLNALVYELFFAEELHAKQLHFFAACEAVGLAKLANLEGEALTRAAAELAAALFGPEGPLAPLLATLQTLDTVRTIEAPA